MRDPLFGHRGLDSVELGCRLGLASHGVQHAKKMASWAMGRREGTPTEPKEGTQGEEDRRAYAWSRALGRDAGDEEGGPEGPGRQSTVAIECICDHTQPDSVWLA